MGWPAICPRFLMSVRVQATGCLPSLCVDSTVLACARADGCHQKGVSRPLSAPLAGTVQSDAVGTGRGWRGCRSYSRERRTRLTLLWSSWDLPGPLEDPGEAGSVGGSEFSPTGHEKLAGDPRSPAVGVSAAPPSPSSQGPSGEICKIKPLHSSRLHGEGFCPRVVSLSSAPSHPTVIVTFSKGTLPHGTQALTWAPGSPGSGQ